MEDKRSLKGRTLCVDATRFRKRVDASGISTAELAAHLHCHPETVRRAKNDPDSSLRATIGIMLHLKIPLSQVFELSSDSSDKEARNGKNPHH